MLEVLVVCEGQTEREFCRDVIGPYLAPSGLGLAGTLVGKPQRKRGGIRPWEVYRKELVRLAKERQDRHLGVLVDYYAMPESWPGRKEALGKPKNERGSHVERMLMEDLAQELPGKFHPCVQLHEFESLLFVEPETAALSIAVGGGNVNPELIARQMMEIKSQFNGMVEQINDSPETAPSKRLLKMIPGYDKVAWGVTAVRNISVKTLRDGCPWLDRWLTRLAALSGN